MAFMKYANAQILTPSVSINTWGNMHTASIKPKSDLNPNLIVRASDLFQQNFDPAQYLLTHITIIASVDTVIPAGYKKGSQLVGGFHINRKYSDFRITKETERYINNNDDAWERGVLLKSYQTFIGGHNFVEHVQVEELSRGRIIDAVARDIGGSIYVDLLIATNRKHKDLIKAIENNHMNTLSMGCTVQGTICSKCGHWAADETEICNHIKYEKGNTFFDAQGRQFKVAELCGHKSIDPHGGVNFIEASWVNQPAFTGAVLRNVLEPTPIVTAKVQDVLNTPPKQWSADSQLKAASQIERVVSYRAKIGGWDDPPDDTNSAPPETKKNPLEDAEADLEKHLMNQVVQRVKNKMKQDVLDDSLSGESSMAPNDSLVKEAKLRMSSMYKVALNDLVMKSSSDVELVDSLASYNSSIGIDIPVAIYRAALDIGPRTRFGSVESFWSKCCQTLGRKPNKYEAKTILRIALLLSQRKSLDDGVQLDSNLEGGN